MSINSTIAERVDAAAYTGKEAKFLDGVTEREFTPEGLRDYIGNNPSPVITANTMLVDNAAGTARESKTFAEVRTSLESISATNLPVIEAWNNGVPGDGTNQTAALQALLDSVNALGGGRILYKGIVLCASGINIDGYKNITLEAVGSGRGPGAAQRSSLRYSGSGSGTFISARDTQNITFRNGYHYATNTAFTGKFIDFGVITDGAKYMCLDDVFQYSNGTAASVMVATYGATEGLFIKVQTSGPGRAFSGQDTAGVLWSNNLTWIQCGFNPSGGVYPITGSGESWGLFGCKFQADSTDGAMRCIDGSTNADMRSLHMDCPSLYDATAVVANTPAIRIPRGWGLNFDGGHYTNVDKINGTNYLIELGGGTGGVHAVKTGGMTVMNATAFLYFRGTSGAGTNVRGWTNCGGIFLWSSGTAGHEIATYVLEDPTSLEGYTQLRGDFNSSGLDTFGNVSERPGVEVGTSIFARGGSCNPAGSSAKGTFVGYDITNDRGFIGAIDVNTANKTMEINPVGGSTRISPHASASPAILSGAIVYDTTNNRFKVSDGAAIRYVQPMLTGSKTFDPTSVPVYTTPGSNIITTTVSVPGAALGMRAQASFSLSQGGLILSAYVDGTGSVTVQFLNPTNAAIDLGSGTLSAWAG